MRSVAKREFKSLFNTMTAEIFCAVLIAVTGIYFIVYNLNVGYPYFSFVLVSVMFIMMIIVPLLTMRSFSEERRQKTDQLLLTSPLAVADIVLGKFLAMCGVLLIPVLVLCLCPLIIKTVGEAHFATDYATLFAFFVVGCFFISVGMFISSLTESQVIAAVCSIGALLIVYLWSGIVSLLPTEAGGTAVVLLIVWTLLALLFYTYAKNALAAAGVWVAGLAALLAVFLFARDWLTGLLPKLLGGFAVTEIMTNFGENNLFDLQGILKLVIVTAVMLFLTAQSIQKRRWS